MTGEHAEGHLLGWSTESSCCSPCPSLQIWRIMVFMSWFRDHRRLQKKLVYETVTNPWQCVHTHAIGAEFGPC